MCIVLSIRMLFYGTKTKIHIASVIDIFLSLLILVGCAILVLFYYQSLLLFVKICFITFFMFIISPINSIIAMNLLNDVKQQASFKK